MNSILEWLVTAEDARKQAKVKHLMRDIIAIVFFAEFANATEWIEIHLFAIANEEPLRRYLELPHGIPSNDTILLVFAMVSSIFDKFHMVPQGGKCKKPVRIPA